MEGNHLVQLSREPMNLRKFFMKFRSLIWRFKTILSALIIGTLIIDILIFRYLISAEFTLDDKISVLSVLAPFTSIAIAA